MTDSPPPPPVSTTARKTMGGVAVPVVPRANIAPSQNGGGGEFVGGSITMALNDWNLLMTYISDLEQSSLQLRSLLSHVEVGADATTTHELIQEKKEEIWGLYSTMNVMTKEMKRLDGK